MNLRPARVAEAFGNRGDLMTATIEDGSSTPLDTMYFRYYVSTDTDITSGYASGLK